MSEYDKTDFLSNQKRETDRLTTEFIGLYLLSTE